VYLRIQCFINLTETSFPQVKSSAFLYKAQLRYSSVCVCFSREQDHLVWSGLEQEDTRTASLAKTSDLILSMNYSLLLFLSLSFVMVV
jgi:hypothetical protein